MYYEEKMVDGVLCWRGWPDGPWTPFTVQELSERLERCREAVSKPATPPTPPERWEDVTAECRAFIWTWDGKEDDTAYYISHDGEMVKENGGYRLRKVEFGAHGNWGFVVEKKVTT